MPENQISPYKQNLLKELQILLATARRAALPFDDHNRCRAAADTIAAAIMAGPDAPDQTASGREVGNGLASSARGPASV
jgi:hypothetical protein